MEHKSTTKNGLTVYQYPNAHSHGFCLALYLRAGSIYEPDEFNGVTHLFEHTIFRNIKSRMEGTLYQVVNENGLYFNACTYKEFVQFHISGAVGHFQQAVAIMMKIFDPFTLSVQDFELEKRRVKAEIYEAADRQTLSYFTDRIVWGGTSTASTITGNISAINRISRKKLSALRDEFLSANNMFFYLTGCYTKEEFNSFIQQAGRLDVRASSLTRNTSAPVPSAFFNRGAQVEVKDDYYHHVRFSFDLDATKYSLAELYLLDDILFHGDNAKLNLALSENHGLVYNIEHHLELYNHVGNTTFFYEIQPHLLYESIEKSVDALRALKEEFTNELDFVKPFYIDNAYLVYDDNYDLNWHMAYTNHILNAKFKSLEERSELFRAVTPQRIKQIINEIFISDHVVVTLKGHKKRIDRQRIHEILLQLDE